jgi:hypothetical protein
MCNFAPLVDRRQDDAPWAATVFAAAIFYCCCGAGAADGFGSLANNP